MDVYNQTHAQPEAQQVNGTLRKEINHVRSFTLASMSSHRGHTQRTQRL